MLYASLSFALSGHGINTERGEQILNIQVAAVAVRLPRRDIRLLLSRPLRRTRRRLLRWRRSPRCLRVVKVPQAHISGRAVVDQRAAEDEGALEQLGGTCGRGTREGPKAPRRHLHRTIVSPRPAGCARTDRSMRTRTRTWPAPASLIEQHV